jgi:NAD(P)H-dependent flavin oxidoreductase YrpB (nitropropane dioxygenase family)
MMAGQSAGLVRDVVPVQVLIQRIVAEAEAAIRRSAAQIVNGRDGT